MLTQKKCFNKWLGSAVSTMIFRGTFRLSHLTAMYGTWALWAYKKHFQPWKWHEACQPVYADAGQIKKKYHMDRAEGV